MNSFGAIADHFCVTLDELLGRGRRRQATTLVPPRLRRFATRRRSLSAIADIMDGRDRSTMRELSERGERLLEGDELLRRRIAG